MCGVALPERFTYPCLAMSKECLPAHRSVRPVRLSPLPHTGQVSQDATSPRFTVPRGR